MVSKLAEAPELTKTLYLTPSQRDHSSSKHCTFFDCVRRIGSSCCRKRMTSSRSARVMLLCISGQSRGLTTGRGDFFGMGTVGVEHLAGGLARRGVSGGLARRLNGDG